MNDNLVQRTKLLFDLQGFVRLRGVLSAEDVAAANIAIDVHSALLAERNSAVLRNSVKGTMLDGQEGAEGRLDLGGMLGWEDPHCCPFRKLLAHPLLVPHLHALVGKGYRLDHSPLVIEQRSGSEGFSLHGGPLDVNGAFNPSLQYRCSNGGGIHNTLLTMSVQLCDVNAGDGGFCVVKGSHKMNFPVSRTTKAGEDSEFWEDCVSQPVASAGDVIIFSEATLHGCMSWIPKNRARRIVLFRFAPAGAAYARGYAGGWPAAFTKGMTPEQLAVMQPPFHPMFDRVCQRDDSVSGTTTTERTREKAEFDIRVFGNKYY